MICGLLTETDLFVRRDGSHADFQIVSGLRIRLHPHEVHVNDEVVAFPEFFPWVFPDLLADTDDLRNIVTTYLEVRLRWIYPAGFIVRWYS